MVTMLITVEIKLSSAVADADCSLLSRWASLAKPAESAGSKSGEVRCIRCVEVGAESVWSSILTEWRQSEKEMIPQIIQDKLGHYTAFSEINGEACN